MSKQDVQVNEVHVGNDGGVDEGFAIHYSDVCCNKAAHSTNQESQGRNIVRTYKIDDVLVSVVNNGVEDQLGAVRTSLGWKVWCG